MHGSLEGPSNFAEQRQIAKPTEVLKSRVYQRSKTGNLEFVNSSNSIVNFNGVDLEEDKVPEVLPMLPKPIRKSLETQQR